MRSDGRDDRPLRVLLTGAAGFIGSHVCRRLLEDGHGVWGLDNLGTDSATEWRRRRLAELGGNPRMHPVEGDVRDGVLLDGLFTSVPFDLVIHLAARSGDRASRAQPELCWDVNATGTLRLLEAMRRHHVGRLIFASSAAVYGTSADSPGAVEETLPAVEPTSPYAASKRAAELLCCTWHRLWGLSVHCLRLFDVYGPDQRPDLPMAVLATRLRDGRPVTVRAGDGDARDLVYVSDVVEIVGRSVAALRALPAGEPTCRILNVGRGRAVDADEVIDLLAGALETRPTVVRRATDGDVLPRPLASTAALEETLGYRPQVDLAEGIERYVEWLTSDASAAVCRA